MQSPLRYTRLISARNHGVDPQAYLQTVIENLPSAKPGELEAVVPANWAAANRDLHPTEQSRRRHAA